MLANTIAPAQPTKKVVKKAKKVDQSLLSTIERLKNKDLLIDNTIIFHFSDGSTTVTNINKQFVTNENGKYLPTHVIIENVNAIMWDNGADSYSIE